ncbi:MAG: hypothetical protein AUG46_08775 [Acidobacteria bacterium 13_1_20CM_3_58_11]|nr:MAG: hypothetical protein AUG46_08775 [Acidobacteria bacterium 13_1_20CM_3_58_11]
MFLQLVTVPLHFNLPPLFAGPLIWLVNNKPFVPPSAFPWGSRVASRGVSMGGAISAQTR